MNPNYIHTITVFRKIGGAWERTVLHDCFWKSNIALTQNGVEASQTNTYTVRIPVESAGCDFVVNPDDIVVKGECEEAITGKTPNTAVDILNKPKPDAFKVTAISDNTAHLVEKHYRLGG